MVSLDVYSFQNPTTCRFVPGAFGLCGLQCIGNDGLVAKRSPSMALSKDVVFVVVRLALVVSVSVHCVVYYVWYINGSLKFHKRSTAFKPLCVAPCSCSMKCGGCTFVWLCNVST